MAGLFNLLKTWIDDETLYAEDLDAEFSNIRDNMVSDQIEGYSTINNVDNDARFDSVVSPYIDGARNYASSVAGEIERLRFQIQAISGTSAWYLPPIVDIQTASTEASVVQPWFFTDSASVRALTASEVIPYRGQGAFNPLNSLNAAFPSARFPLGTNRKKKLTISFRGSGNIVNKYLATIPMMGIRVFMDSNGFPNLSVRSWHASDVGEKSQVTFTGSETVYGPVIHTYTVCLDWSGAAGTHYVAFFVDGVLVGQTNTTTLGYPNVIAPIMYVNYSYESMWEFQLSTYHLAFQSSDQSTWNGSWSRLGSGTVVADGNTLTISSAGAAQNGYLSSIYTNGVEFVMRVKTDYLSTNGTLTSGIYGFNVSLSCASTVKDVTIFFNQDGIAITDALFNTTNPVWACKLDCTNWHLYSISFDGTIVKIWVDNILIANVTLTHSSLSGVDYTSFGYMYLSNSDQWSGSIEFANFAMTTAAPYTGNISSQTNFWDGVVALRNSYPATSVVIPLLSSADPSTIFGRYLPLSRAYSELLVFALAGTISTTTAGGATLYQVGDFVYSDGQKPLRVTMTGSINITAGSSTSVFVSILYVAGTPAAPNARLLQSIKVPAQIVPANAAGSWTLNVNYSSFLPAGAYVPYINLECTGSSGAANIPLNSLQVMFTYDGDIT